MLLASYNQKVSVAISTNPATPTLGLPITVFATVLVFLLILNFASFSHKLR